MAKKNTEKKNKKKTIAIGLGIVLLLAAILMFISFFRLGVIPVRFIIPGIAVSVVLIAFFVFLQFTKFNIPGNILTILLAALFVGIMFFNNNIYSEINKTAKKQNFTFSVLVLMEDDAKKIEDTYSYFFGYNTAADKELTEKAVIDITNDVSLRPVLKEYSGLSNAVKDLFDGKIKALIFNEAYRPLMEKLYPDFNQQTRILKSYEFEKDINTFSEHTDDSFAVYFSYNSRTGDIEPYGESERNLVAAVYMNTKKAVVIELPPDLLVNMKTDAFGGEEEFSHITLNDVNYIPATLKELIGIDINYFVKAHMEKNEKSNIASIVFNDKAKYFTNLPPGIISQMLQEEIFFAGDWQIDYYKVEGSQGQITGAVCGVENITVTIPDKAVLDEISKRLNSRK